MHKLLQKIRLLMRGIIIMYIFIIGIDYNVGNHELWYTEQRRLSYI